MPEVNIDIDQDKIAQMVADELGADEDIRDQIQNTIDKRVTKALDSYMPTLIAARAERLIDEAMTTGFQRTNTWGDAQGDPVSVATLVRDYMTVPVADPSEDRYHRQSGKTPLAHWAIRGLLKRSISKGFQKELENAQVEIRKAVDGLVRERLSTTLRQALGLCK